MSLENDLWKCTAVCVLEKEDIIMADDIVLFCHHLCSKWSLITRRYLYCHCLCKVLSKESSGSSDILHFSLLSPKSFRIGEKIKMDNIFALFFLSSAGK